MARRYKSPFDSKTFTSVKDLENYVEKKYKDKVPKEYKGDIEHYLYDYRNGKGTCRICGYPTEWDKEKKKYKILCEANFMNRFRNLFRGKLNTCQEIMRKYYLENIKKKYDTDNLMNSIEYQNMLLQNRRIAKIVHFKGNEMTVIGSYEALFVQVCDKVLNKKDDLVAPGPTVNWSDGITVKQHITDFYIKSIDCVVSIKDEGFGNEDNPKVKKKRKDDAYKFQGILKDKRKFKAVIELAGKEEIKRFKDIYKEIKDSKERYIIYPKNYDILVK